MLLKLLIRSFTVVLGLSAPALGQISGSYNYALGGSSVMRVVSPSALFLNPGELARIHQRELSFSTSHFSELPQISVAEFIPFVGTLAAGIGNEFGRSQYSLGYARILTGIQTIGGSLNVLKGSTTEITLSLGSSFHLLDEEGRYSGLQLGSSVINFSSNTSLPNQRFIAGGGYWAIPNRLCVQGSLLYQDKHSKFPVGAEYLLMPELRIQLGTESFDDFYGGVSYTEKATRFDASVGEQGISFSITFRFSDDSRVLRDNYYEQGMKAYRQEEYPGAKEAFRNSLEYDEYFSPARTYVSLSEGISETSTQILLYDAEQYIRDGNILDAKKNFTKVLKMYPEDGVAKNGLIGLKPRLQSEAKKLEYIADSLMRVSNFDGARDNYLLAFEYDAEDEEILKRLSLMEKMIADTIAVYMEKGNNYFVGNQLESARKAYEKVLQFDSGNTEAENYLSIIKEKTKASAVVVKTQRTSREGFDRGKTAFDKRNYFDAISFFAEYLKQDPKNSEAQAYIDKSRDSLRPQLEGFFKFGLQFYVEEQYKKALEIWNQALLVDPEHHAILEYKKRAELKMDALEKLK